MPRIAPLTNQTALLVGDRELRFMSGDLAPSRLLRGSLGRYLRRVADMRDLEAQDLRIVAE